MKKILNSMLWFMAFFAMATFISCNKDEDVKFELKSLMAGDIDLNGATAAIDIPANAVITATFSKNVDETTLAISLKQDYDNATIEKTIEVNGKVVTITPAALGSGTLYILGLDVVKATDGDALTAVTRNFTTAGSFVPTGQIAYWPFDGNANDVVGTYDPPTTGIVDITYSNARKTAAGQAATFNGTTSIIEVPNGDQLINTHNFTLSFWVKTNSTGITHGHFVMGLGAFYGIQFEIFGGYDGAKFAISYEKADGTTTAEDMWFPSNATDNTTGGWQGWDYAKVLTPEQMIALLKDTWLQVVYTYNGTERKGTLYYNGVKMKSFDFDLWPDEDAKRGVVGLKYGGAAPDVVNELAFGFIQSRAGTMWDAEPWGGYGFAEANHFKGQLDDIRIFHKALSAQEVTLMYNSEKP